MARLTYTAAALAFLSTVSGAAVSAQYPVQFNNGGVPTPSCLAIVSDTNGGQGVLGACDAASPNTLTNPLARSWVVAKGSGTASTIAVFGDQCLDVRDGKNAEGAVVQTYACNAGNTNQQWKVNSDLTITWNKDNTKCLDVDLRHGVTVINTCKADTTSQKWKPNSPVQWPAAPKNKQTLLKINDHHTQLTDNTGSCMAIQDDLNNGAVVNVQSCEIIPINRSFTVVNGGSNTGAGPTGPIKVGENYCLDVKDGKDQDGTKIQIWQCYANSKNQQFQVNGDGSIKWMGGNNKCIDLTGGDEAGHAQLQIWTCSGSNYNQKWIPFPL